MQPLKPQPKPIFESDANALVLDSYLLLQVATHCACGHITTHNDLQEVWLHPTKTATSGLKVLKPTTSLKSGLPIARAHAKPRTLPICEQCWTIEKHGQRVSLPPLSYIEWENTVRRKALDARPQSGSPPASEPKPEPRLDTL